MIKHQNPQEITLIIHDSAKKRLKKIHDNNHFFLLSVKKSGCSGYSYSFEKFDKNKLVDFNNLQIIDKDIDFYVDKNYINMLNNIEMEWVEASSFESYFSFKNPNIINHCGCGESFNNE